MRRTLICCVLATAAASGVAGCGSSSSGGAPADPQSDPKTAATAFIAALKTGDVATVCKYVQVPAQAGSCPDLLSQALAGRGGFTGDATVGNDAISGDQALVVTTGDFSVMGQQVSNSDPNAGLPSGSTTFAQAYAAAQGDPSSPDLTMTRVGSEWFVSPSTN